MAINSLRFALSRACSVNLLNYCVYCEAISSLTGPGCNRGAIAAMTLRTAERLEHAFSGELKYFFLETGDGGHDQR